MKERVGPALMVLVLLALASNAGGQCVIGELAAPNSRRVAMDGSIIVVGDHEADGGGAAYVYREDDDGVWRFEQELASPVENLDGVYGISVAVEGEVAVVGDYYADAPEFEQGAAYVFRFDGTTWAYELTLTASDGTDGDLFAHWLDMDEGRVVVGARDADDGLDRIGAVYVYRFNRGAWYEEAVLTHPDRAPFDLLGGSVAIDWPVIVAGAHGRTVEGVVFAGAAAVWRDVGAGAWEFEAELTADDPVQGGAFGRSVAVSGDWIIVGAPEENLQDGAAYAFHFENGTWLGTQRLLPSNAVGLNPSFGANVAIDDDLALIGSIFDSEFGTKAGAAYSYREQEGEWIEQAKLVPSQVEAHDHFAASLALDGARAAASASGNETAPFVLTRLEASPCPCHGNLDHDRRVGFGDLLVLLAAWGSVDHSADLNGDSVVAGIDLMLLITAWGPCD